MKVKDWCVKEGRKKYEKDVEALITLVTAGSDRAGISTREQEDLLYQLEAEEISLKKLKVSC